MSARGPQGRGSGQPPRGGTPFPTDDLLPPTVSPHESDGPASAVPQPVVAGANADSQEQTSGDLPPTVNPSPAPTTASAATPRAQPASPAARATRREAAAAGKSAARGLASGDGRRPRQVQPAPGPPGQAAPRRALLRNAPPWLVSLVVHLVAILVLALIYLPSAAAHRFEIQVSSTNQLAVPVVEAGTPLPTLDLSQLSEDEFSLADEPAEDPLAASQILDVRLESFGAATDLVAPTIGRSFSGRERGAKGALLAAYGGTAETENAVQLGLEWLVRNQGRGGAWSLTGRYADGAPFENEAAATAMALLALLGSGQTHEAGEFQESVARGAQALVKMQDGNGNFYHSTVDNHRLYSQAQATIAVCELYGMTRDQRFRDAAQRALDYAAEIQADDGQGGGGWRYLPYDSVDTSVTGWFVMALASGRMAELDVSEQVLEKVSIYLDHVTEDGSRYRYRPLDRDVSVSMSAEALLCRQYLGWQRDDSRLLAGADYLLEHPIDWQQRNRNVYAWYYATQVLHHMGGEYWERWNEVLRRVIPKHQNDAGRERGSWEPQGDRYGPDGGRLYVTCLCIYMLEVYYRHLPLYREP